jgi:hypothetical protein
MVEQGMGLIQPATWQLPAGHEAVSCWANQASAAADARARIPDGSYIYYLTDKRGAWEVIQAPRQR